VPAVTDEGWDVNTSEVAVPGLTVIEFEVTVNVPSLAVIVFEPAVFKVIVNDFVPPVSVDEDGKIAAPSLDVIATVPEYPVTVLPEASFAVTVTENGEPAVVLAGTLVKTNEVALPEVTVTAVVLETATLEIVAPNVTDPAVAPVKTAV
jgi:hypothetical protein